MRDAKVIGKLECLQSRLEKEGLEVSLSSLDTGPFLHATHLGRSAEASTVNDRDHWWIELWERSDDPDAAPVFDRDFSSEEEVFKALGDWLREIP